ncbi:MAG: Fic family protein [Flammeovirgaceae bacterium]|nr:MAG: Fic family protein [Flammeovirgaceae bacterium]
MKVIDHYKSGFFREVIDYKSFIPELINTTWSWTDHELTRLAEKSAIAIGQLDAYSHQIPNIDHFIRMYVAKEATVSSRIEGTQTNMEEAMLNETDIHPERRDDWKEVNNYIHALNDAIASLPALPISSRLLKQAHATLLSGVRGRHKLPGEFRRSQNWIGGSSIRTAVFIPPPHEEVEALMGDLENFLHNEENGLTSLMQIAVAHYQFETIHPFLDGNGRIGRLMITLFMVDKGILQKPVLYLSDFFEKNKTFYYDYLTRVRTHNDLLGWVKFFLKGVLETSSSASQALKDLLALKKDCEEKRIYQLGKKINSAKVLLDYLYQRPIVDAEEVSRVTRLSLVSAYKLLDDFMRLRILNEMTGAKRNRLFAFEEYFTIFKR